MPAIPRPTACRRRSSSAAPIRPSLPHRGVPRLRPAAEAGRVQDGGSGLARQQGAEHRHARLEDRRLPRHQLRRHPRDPVPGRTGFGYFPNVGRTRRQGLEAEVNIKSPTLQFQASYALRRRALPRRVAIGSNSPFADGDGNIQVSPGNQLPAIPRHRVKVGVDYAVTDVWKVGGNALFVSSQYLVGDESNQYAKLPSYTVFNLHTSYQVTKNFQLYGRSTTSSTSATRPTDSSSTAKPCPTSPMAAPSSPTRARSARQGRVRSMRGCG